MIQDSKISAGFRGSAGSTGYKVYIFSKIYMILLVALNIKFDKTSPTWNSVYITKHPDAL